MTTWGADLANYLVTGCAGFIGARVAELLLAQGDAVIGLDNMNPAYDVRLKEWRLAQLRGHPDFIFQLSDICQWEALRALRTHSTKFDAIIHLAAYAGVLPSVSNPRVYYDTNALGTLNLLELCREFAIKKFIFASTSSLYGAHNPLPFREDANTDAPLSPYAASKKAAEVLCYTYHYLYGLDIAVLRYFTVYGPAGRPDMSVFRFVQSIVEGRLITIYGDGNQSRSFTYIDDIVTGTVAALKLKGYEIINLGNDQVVSLKQVIQHIEQLAGQQATVGYRPRHPADVTITQADITKAKRLLDWLPQTSLEKGLQTTIDWYIKNRSWAKEIKEAVS